MAHFKNLHHIYNGRTNLWKIFKEIRAKEIKKPRNQK